MALVSGCGGPRLTVINESSAWLRFEAAAEIDPRQAYVSGPLAGDASVRFGVPPGGRIEQALEPGGSIFVRRRLGLVLSVRAGPNPNGPGAREPLLSEGLSIRMVPPGPYALRFRGEPGSIEVVRIDAEGQPVDESRMTVLPQASLF
ncbi:MAG: hypothetical protein RIB58_01650 [Phycisphaerales bacterium]